MLLPAANLAAFSLAAALLTLTPGLDTALVLRVAIAEGRGRAMLAALGIALGCLCWGVAAAVGLGALLTASEALYTLIKWAGAVYLVWLGISLLRHPRRAVDAADATPAARSGTGWLARGLVTNLLNPKVGVFYISFLPQFIPAGSDAMLAALLLALIHVAMGPAWFALLLTLGKPLAGRLRHPAMVARLDRLTGTVFIAFGLRLALDRRV